MSADPCVKEKLFWHLLKNNKPNMFNYRCVSGGRWLEDIDNIQCFFSSFLASELYLRDSEPGCVREDGTKAGSAVRRDKTRQAFTRQNIYWAPT